MKRRRTTLALAIALAASATLAACDDYDRGDYRGGGGYMPPPPPPPPQPPMTRLEDRFGTAFGQAFRADPNAQPVDPAQGSIVALSLAADPVDIPSPTGGSR